MSLQKHQIDGPVGALEVALELPDGAPRGIALIAHPHPLYGGNMDNKVVTTLAKAFVELGCVGVRFNYRGVGESQGSYAEGLGEADDARAVLAWARARFGDALPVSLAGFSFGSFVQFQLHAEVAPQHLVLVGPAVGRFALGDVPTHTLVIHGESDETVPLTDVMHWARPQALPVVVFPDCGHFFHGRLLALRDVVKRICRF